MQNPWISSLEIIARTGLSRQTLNNYIKWGLLPKPQVRKPDDSTLKARRVGYFDLSVLETIASVQAMKRKGTPMAEIKRMLVDDRHLEAHAYSAPSAPNPLENQEKIMPETVTAPMRQVSLFDPDAEVKDEVFDATPGYGTGYDVSGEMSAGGPSVHPQLFLVLAATLKDAALLRAEWLPEDYLKLWQRLWHAAETIVREGSGRWLVRDENAIIAYFLQDIDADRSGRVIACGFHLLKYAEKISAYIKQRNKYIIADLLSIGIHVGYDYIHALSADSGGQIVDAGETTAVALRLSQYGKAGTFWSTKAFVNRMSEESRKGIRFGIRGADGHGGEFQENRFLRVGDFPAHGGQDPGKAFPEIAGVPVTEIIEQKNA